MNTQKLILRYNDGEIAVESEICDNIFSKMMGKMFSFNKKPLLFVFDKEQDVKIHMLFVFMPLLVIWLDENKKIIQIKKMKPFISFEGARAKYVLEIPLNSKETKDALSHFIN
jgi:uncharacterized protein